jgi:hypothetical protein
MDIFSRGHHCRKVTMTMLAWLTYPEDGNGIFPPEFA